MKGPEVARELLLQLLQDGEPELGARLKQRLSTAFVIGGHGALNHRLWGFPKFIDFLQANSDILQISRPSGPGDVTVALRSDHCSNNPTLRRPVANHPKIRNDVWQAFTNVDAQRQRFYNRNTGIVHTFSEEESPDFSDFNLDHGERVEIRPIGGGEHLEWMRDFVANLDIPDEQRGMWQRMLDTEYSSSLNATFTSLLGSHGLDWRRQRSRHVFGKIQEWATANKILLSALQESPPSPLPQKTDHTQSPQVAPTPPSNVSEARVRVTGLLDLLSDDDLDSIVLPLLLSTLWTKTRITR